MNNDYIIRRTAGNHGVMLITNRQLAMRLAEARSRTDVSQSPIES